MNLVSETLWVAGVDEVGRGALFGPVVAAAVILPPTVIDPLKELGVRDSKRLSPKIRVNLSQQIQAIALDCKVGLASAREIDRLNILQATLLAMKRSILRLNPQPQLCLVDGNQSIPNLSIQQQTIIKGDQTSIAIASASIVAKVWRDRLIIRLAQKYPNYDLIQNKGYGTKKHREALQRYGVSPQHRLSFRPCQVLINDK